MSVAAKVAAHLPYVRRYARALAGSQEAGDRLVRTLLEAALADAELLSAMSGSRASLYAAFTPALAIGSWRVGAGRGAGGLHERAAQDRLGRITPRNRQALLLTTLEDFSVADAATIMACSPDEIETLVSEAIAEIDAKSRTDVLIIEDEPLISMQLEDLVCDLGHSVVGTAATRSQAQQTFADAARPRACRYPACRRQFGH